MRIAALIAVAALVASRPADACIPAFVRGIVGAPAFEPAGAVTITGEEVTVDCDDHYVCTVISTFGIAVTQGARARVTGSRTIELTLAASGRTASARPVGSAHPALLEQRSDTDLELAPADTQLVLRARVAMPEYIDSCFTDGVIARHLFLPSRPAGHERVLQIDTTVTPRVKRPASWSLVVSARPATDHDSAATWLWFDVPRRLFTHGGPLLMFGSASGAGSLLRVRAAWEVAIARPWLVFALAGDTDFGDAWNVAVTAEPTTRAWLLPMTFGLGGGVVLDNGMRLGGRAQLSIALGAFRAVLSLDAIAGDTAELSLAALFGVGL